MNLHTSSVESSNRETLSGIQFQAPQCCPLCEDQHDDSLQQLRFGPGQSVGHGQRVAAQGEQAAPFNLPPNTFNPPVLKLSVTDVKQKTIPSVHSSFSTCPPEGDQRPQDCREMPVCGQMAHSVRGHRRPRQGLERQP